MNELHEWIWSAGFFDGEGSVSLIVYKRITRDYPYIRIGITQANPEVLERFRDAVGVGTVNGPHKPGKNSKQPIWNYQATNRAAVVAFGKIWPWLSTQKREQATRAMEGM